MILNGFFLVAGEARGPVLATEPLWSPLFDDVRAAPRFRAALARLGLEGVAARSPAAAR